MNIPIIIILSSVFVGLGIMTWHFLSYDVVQPIPNIIPHRCSLRKCRKWFWMRSYWRRVSVLIMVGLATYYECPECVALDTVNRRA